nr:hypothetical protein [uncultured Hyphomonas sp.]
MAKKSMTAAELIASTANDPAYLAMKAEQDRKRAELRKILDADQAELVAELNATGIEPVKNVWDLVSRPNNYDDALEVLTSHLFKPHHPRVMEGIVRSLAMRHLSGMTALWEKFAQMYLETHNDQDIEEPARRGLKFALILGLEALMSDDVADLLRQLVHDSKGHQHADCLEDLLAKYESDDHS